MWCAVEVLISTVVMYKSLYRRLNPSPKAKARLRTKPTGITVLPDPGQDRDTGGGGGGGGREDFAVLFRGVLSEKAVRATVWAVS